MVARKCKLGCVLRNLKLENCNAYCMFSHQELLLLVDCKIGKENSWVVITSGRNGLLFEWSIGCFIGFERKRNMNLMGFRRKKCYYHCSGKFY